MKQRLPIEKGISFLLLVILSACHQSLVIVPTPVASHTGSNEVVASLPRHDSFATYTFKTGAPTLAIEAATTCKPERFYGLAHITACVDGKVWRTFRLTQPQQSFTLHLDSIAGPHQVSLIEGGQLREADKGTIEFTSLTGLRVDKGQHLDSVATSYTQGLVVWADSRSVGGGDPLPAQQAWPILLRSKFPQTEIFTPGYGSLVFSQHISTPAQRAAVVAGIVQRLRRYKQQQLWFEVGLNDYYTAACTPQQLGVAYRELLLAVHEALPTAKIYLQTDVVAKNEAPNKLGYSLQHYREAEAASGAGLPYVRVLDGRELGTAADLSADGFHLSPAGDARFATRVAPILAY